MPHSEDEMPSDRSENRNELAEPSEGPDILDWDACIETPPPRPSGKVKVRLNYRGRGKPIPLDPPEDDRSREAS
jgi:hypothetical protein